MLYNLSHVWHFKGVGAAMDSEQSTPAQPLTAPGPSAPNKHAVHAFHLFVEPSPDDHFCQFCGVPLRKAGLCLRDSRNPPESKDIYCVNCLVCPQKHLLRPRYALTHIPNGTYAKNVFSCDCCSRTMSVKTFVTSCPACEFDLCPECLDAHTRLPDFGGPGVSARINGKTD